jgi:hypothetical protein
MKEKILEEFNGQYCTTDMIVEFVEGAIRGALRKTIIWNINDLIRQGKAVRVGRGVYGFMSKKRFNPAMSEASRRVCSIIHNNFKYLIVTVTDTSVLGQFMNLQPFSTVVVIEARKSATGAVLSALRKEGVEAYAKRDYAKLEQYVSSPQTFLIRPELSVNPNLTQYDNVRASSLEKILVDLVCDYDIYGQYQGEELINIYKNSTFDYAVNISQVLKYAAARKKKASVLAILQETDVYDKIRGFI